MHDLYDRDFAVWAEQQAAALREGRLTDIDGENLAEEIEALARRDRRELRSRLTVLESHLLKLEYQPEATTTSWRSTIRQQVNEIRYLLDDSVSLQNDLKSYALEAYDVARRTAADETELPLVTFPDEMAQEFANVLWAALLRGDCGF